MSTSRDKQLLDQSVRALLRVSDWLSETKTVEVDGAARDALGELIHAVDEAREGLEVHDVTLSLAALRNQRREGKWNRDVAAETLERMR